MGLITMMEQHTCIVKARVWVEVRGSGSEGRVTVVVKASRREREEEESSDADMAMSEEAAADLAGAEERAVAEARAPWRRPGRVDPAEKASAAGRATRAIARQVLVDSILLSLPGCQSPLDAIVRRNVTSDPRDGFPRLFSKKCWEGIFLNFCIRRCFILFL